jgi:hypothetical protein
MTLNWPVLVYSLCLLGSALCAILLFRAWQRENTRLLLWSCISFGFFAFNSLALVCDIVIFPEIPLWPLRIATHLLAFSTLLCGFVWEANR